MALFHNGFWRRYKTYTPQERRAKSRKNRMSAYTAYYKTEAEHRFKMHYKRVAPYGLPPKLWAKFKKWMNEGKELLNDKEATKKVGPNPKKVRRRTGQHQRPGAQSSPADAGGTL